ncbi:MAG: class I SAM-dependent methyltransferase [Janthinobacterium lividum]
MGVRELINKLKNMLLSHAENEQEYYEKLFIHSSHWNKPFPNLEEWQRWLIIRGFLEEDIIKDIHNHNRSDFQLLDVGCGRGWLSNLCSTYGEVTGIERVKKVVKYAKTLFPALEIRWQTPDELLEQHKQYDLIICSEVIEHVPDLQKNSFAKKLFLLLKPGGSIIITTPRQEILSEWQQYTNPSQPVEDWLSEQQVQFLFSNFEVVNKKQLSIPPRTNINPMPVYQLWLFRKP